MRFLAEATAALASSLNYDETLERVARLAVPVLADWCVVDVVDAQSRTLRRVGVAHRDPAFTEVARGWAHRYPTDWSAPRGVSEVIRTGQPELVREVSDRALVEAARDAEDLKSLRALGLHSYLIVPLVGRERTLGAITLVSAGSQRRYSEADVELAQDLGRRAALAIENARAHFEAQQAIRARDRLLATVSHDLRNPLSAVSLIVSTLRDEAGDSETGKQLAVVLAAVERMKKLINDMLDTSAIQQGRLKLERKLVDACKLISDVIETERPLAQDKRIELAADMPASAQLECDPDRVAQVLANLLGNAIAFCRPGDQVRVTLSIDGERARVVVADTGPGIASADLPHIFEPYWTAAKDAPGHGLGLYICKGIVEAHGGTMWAESAPWQGTRISFTLPAVAPG